MILSVYCQNKNLFIDELNLNMENNPQEIKLWNAD